MKFLKSGTMGSLTTHGEEERETNEAKEGERAEREGQSDVMKQCEEQLHLLYSEKYNGIYTEVMRRREWKEEAETMRLDVKQDKLMFAPANIQWELLRAAAADGNSHAGSWGDV